MKVKTDKVPLKNESYLTNNRSYEVIQKRTNGLFIIADDNGHKRIIRPESCAHLGWAAWEVLPL